MNKLKELRKAAGLSQAELAERSGMKQQHISAYEKGINGIRNMSYEKAKAIAKALNCKMEDLDDE